MRIHVHGCEASGEDVEIVTRIALDRVGARRAASLAARMAAAASRDIDAAFFASEIGEIARASETMELMLTSDPGGEVRLGLYLDRFLCLRSTIAERGEFRLSTVDFAVDFSLARAAAYILCDLISVIERPDATDGPDVKIAIERQDDRLLLAMSSEDMAEFPVVSMAGSRALRRAEHLVHSIGGTLTRGMREGRMLFAVGLPVTDG